MAFIIHLERVCKRRLEHHDEQQPLTTTTTTTVTRDLLTHTRCSSGDRGHSIIGRNLLGWLQWQSALSNEAAGGEASEFHGNRTNETIFASSTLWGTSYGCNHHQVRIVRPRTSQDIENEHKPWIEATLNIGWQQYPYCPVSINNGTYSVKHGLVLFTTARRRC